LSLWQKLSSFYANQRNLSIRIIKHKLSDEYHSLITLYLILSVYWNVRLTTVLYCTVLYCTVLYCTVLYCTVLYCTVLHCTVLYCTVLYCTVLYCKKHFLTKFSSHWNLIIFNCCLSLKWLRPRNNVGNCQSLTLFKPGKWRYLSN